MSTYHLNVRSGKRGSAGNHANYIGRQGKYERRQGDLVCVESGNMPAWTQGNPRLFWRAADAHERKNGAAYREIVIALPRELDSDQQKQLVNTFIKKVLGNRPYEAAIHCPAASLGEVDQPHSHIMFSDRIDDGIVRSPEIYFKRYNAKHPELGGVRKESGGKTPKQLRDGMIQMRQQWEIFQNAALAQYGNSSRVDHRSHRDRGISKPPERHLGQHVIRCLTENAREAFLAKREAD